MSNSRSNRITAIDEEEQEETNLIQRNKVHVRKRSNYDYESYRIRLLSKLKPGDHIAAERKNGMYEHHGIFEGISENKEYPAVIHFQGPITSLVKGCASKHCVWNCGYKQPKKGGPVFSCIDCFSNGDKTFKMQYRLNKDLLSDQDPNWRNLKPGKVITGYCNKKFYLEHYLNGELYGHSIVSKKKSSDYPFEDQIKFYELSSERSSQEVLDVARDSKFKPYSLGCNNCEHFAVFCKTGLSRSLQVENFPVPVICENGKRVCRLMAKDKSKVQNGHENLKQDEQESLEVIQAKETDEDEEKVLLKSMHTFKRRKTSKDN